MKTIIRRDADDLGIGAGKHAATSIRQALGEQGNANIILATGTSQFQTLHQLMIEPDIDWTKVVLFHLDEYIGLPISHPASFRKYLMERFISKVSPFREVHLIDGEGDPISECRRLNDLIAVHPIDVALVGIGENCHLAFNDPPADFKTEEPYIVVDLDDQCVQQQLGEGWFPSVSEVPRHAISMSIKQILKSKEIVCSVPDSRKALAVKNCLEQEVNNLYPASILQTHPHCTLFLDTSSAALLSQDVRV